ncbi:ATP-binding protein [Streptomyces sp. NRRL WC-3618]|uniref:ATP-binding protein n=1 Tax=Streptomyces sp. NRRL WC-3618 TaxID=1519490 RepID=UPI002D21D2D2|nr:ATP-binding protein [Streptomyces sp. NRRL WC-3618]
MHSRNLASGLPVLTHGHVPGRDFQLRLQLNPRTVRVEVTDTRTERQPPTPGQAVPPSAESESGRGLLLVQELSHAWGITERTIGKTIWAEVSLQAAHLTGSPDLPARGETATHSSRHLPRP